MRRGLKRIVPAAVAALTLSAGVGITAAGAGPGQADRRPSPNTRILYQGFDTVRSVRPDGSHQRVLAHVDLDPSHHIISLRDLAGSRNGKRIFAVTESISSGPSGGLIHRIIRYDGRGGQRKPLFNASFTKGTASITATADGKRIVFPTSSDLYSARADGHGPLHRLLHNVRVKHPAVSSDGRRIVFERNTSGNQDIWGMDTSGGPMTRLTSRHADETWPVFSPLGIGICPVN